MTARRRRRRRGEDGFTLAELVVALAVVGLMTGGAVGLTGLLRTADGRSDRAAREIEAVAGAERVFRTVVAQAVADAGAERPALPPGGSADRLVMVSLGPASLPVARPQPLELRVEQAADGLDLELAWSDPESGRRSAEAVVTGARSIGFQYFVRDDATGRDAWTDRWENGAALPHAVMLRLAVGPDGRAYEIVVRTRATGEGCSASWGERACPTLAHGRAP